jgi:hypothetical protein
MKKLLLLPMLAWLASAALVRAQVPAVEIASPDRAVPYAKSQVQGHTLFWDQSRQELFAVVDFVEDLPAETAAHNESFQFAIPGVAFDSKTGLFTVADAAGTAFPVAQRHGFGFLNQIKPTPNAFFRIQRDDAKKITVVLDVYRPEVAAALKQVPEPTGEKVVPLGSVLR